MLQASFCVIDQDNIIPEKYTTYFRSVIAFGNIHIMENEIEIKKAIDDLAKKYYPADNETGRNAEIRLRRGRGRCEHGGGRGQYRGSCVWRGQKQGKRQAGFSCRQGC